MSRIATELLDAFSSTTLELQRLARDTPIERFRSLALAELQRLLPFHKAWWGRSAMNDGIPEPQSSHLHNLPARYVTDWQLIRHEDTTIDRVHANLGQAAIVDLHATDTPPGLRWLGERYGIGELLCIVHTDPETALSDHLALYRNPGAPRFTGQDRLLINQLMRHLVVAVSTNQIHTLANRREGLSNPRNLALAICDARGILHCAERGFVELLLSEWPDWTGPRLPMSLDPLAPQDCRLQIEVSAAGDLLLVAARSLVPLQRLSARENDVAQRFGEGMTYKEIARELGVAPNTVRHHIRTIYSKLGVNDKARIAQLLHAPPD
ncbi:helix-turn-helix transcriptional regulator [Metapseudomonas furukawaii]|jgi:DNA-binding CsgD family transcriptional regulator|uniref:Probable transcription regulator PA3771 n=1 Tax=Metapseudomonas furukawaii TaxID=1149133 RepID=A0AAD1C163_METFU|nr:helix-turn-helix transcriptional regulator [Pseudomonas furukawaii]ELS25061.1 DNA-binding HTH domain-containing protein [Pseudomonas furukawaii]WAG76915.1 LuxR C-terminal-related transcriptional regulator [Pseudomonas furukawaii]BAU74882.1 probable transcription regulator PA3771 [Pseudomonas furukawaii]